MGGGFLRMGMGKIKFQISDRRFQRRGIGVITRSVMSTLSSLQMPPIVSLSQSAWELTL